MRRLLLSSALLLLAMPALAETTVADCQKRHDALETRSTQFSGEELTRQLIKADLDRATRELRENDVDECMEALDHAETLLARKS